MAPRDTSLGSYQSDETSPLVNGGKTEEKHFSSPPPHSILRRRLMDAFIGFVLAAAVFTLVGEHHQEEQQQLSPTTSTSSSGGSRVQDSFPSQENTSHEENNDVASTSSGLRGNNKALPFKELNLQGSKYDKFQAMGFSIYTGGSPVLVPDGKKHGKMVHNPECKGMNEIGYSDDSDQANNTILFECYLGHDDPIVDIHKRMQVMYDAVDRAYEAADKDPTTLKIFNAPEFFFRGKEGAYILNATDDKSSRENGDCTELCQILSGLESLVANKKYQDWLFLFGSVVIAEAMPQNDDYDYLFYNFAPVYKGYDPKTADHWGKRFLVPKRYVSNMDFLTPARQYVGNLTKEVVSLKKKDTTAAYDSMVETSQNGQYGIVGEHPSQNEKKDDHEEQHIVDNPFWYLPFQLYYDTSMWNNYQSEIKELGYVLLEDDWLIMDNITFSIEICLDHDFPASRALNSYMYDNIMESNTRIPKSVETWDPIAEKNVGSIDMVPIPRHMAQISLVSSMGMNLKRQSMALANGGTILLQDGEKGNNGTMTETRGCDGWFNNEFDGGSELITRTILETPNKNDYRYKLHAAQQFVGLYNDTSDSTDETWKQQVRGFFSTAHHEPLVRVYETQHIAKVSNAY